MLSKKPFIQEVIIKDWLSIGLDLEDVGVEQPDRFPQSCFVLLLVLTERRPLSVTHNQQGWRKAFGFSILFS